jgi:hypothetical protein
LPGAEGDGHSYVPPAGIHILNNLVIGKSRGAAILIMQRHLRVVRRRTFENQFGKKLKLLAAGHLRPRLGAGDGHDRPSPRMT